MNPVNICCESTKIKLKLGKEYEKKGIDAENVTSGIVKQTGISLSGLLFH